jgi:hypothetical protein
MVWMYLYHFTDWKNLQSIEDHGLLCRPLLDSKGIRYWPSSNADSRRLDVSRNLHHYVRLCTGRYHPMASACLYQGRIQRIAWLRIDPQVVYWRSTLFSDDNATARRATIGHDPDLALLSQSSQAEVMIRDRLATRWIRFP